MQVEVVAVVPLSLYSSKKTPLFCKNCGVFSVDIPRCKNCNSYQSLPKEWSFFELFDLPFLLKIDEEVLRNRYYLLTKQIHPDIMTARIANHLEMVQSMQWTALTNKAYQVLKDQFSRGQYILEFLDIKTSSLSPPMELALEYFEAIETQIDKNKIHKFQIKLESLLHELHEDWERLSQQWLGYELKEDENIKKLNYLIQKRKYLLSLKYDLEKRKG